MTYHFQSIDAIACDSMEELMSLVKMPLDNALAILCLEGQMDIRINHEPYHVQKNDMIFCMPDTTIGEYQNSEDFRTQVIAVPTKSLNDALYVTLRREKQWYNKLIYITNHPVIRLSEKNIELGHAFENIFRIFGTYPTIDYHEQMAEVLAQGMIIIMLSWINEQMSANEENETLADMVLSSKQDVHLQHFMQLLQEQHGRKRDVSWYANALNITPKYLAFICKKCSDQSPLQFINDFAIREIKQQLLTTNHSIKQIAYDMNFPNASMFCKYFRIHTGTTPLEFRESNRH